MATIDQEYSQEVRNAQISFDRDGFEGSLEWMGKACMPLLNLPSSDTENGRVPILRADQLTKYMIYVKEHVPNVKEKVILGSSHFPHVDRPEVIASAIDDFVRDIRM